MSSKSDVIFKILTVLSYIVFIGLCIEAGTLIFNFIFSWFKPEATHNLYGGLDLSELYAANEIYYQSVYSLVIILAISKAHIFYLIIEVLGKLNLVKPFSEKVGKLIFKISYNTFSLGILGWITRSYTKWLDKHDFVVSPVEGYWEDYQAYLLMAGIIYVIAQIFQRGLEMQNENDLTV